MQLSKTLFVLSLALASSCAFARQRTHEPIAPTSVQSIEVGDSAGRVTELLGAPSEVVQLGTRSAYRYDFTETKSTGLFLLVIGFFNVDSHQDRVWVFFDEDENVTHVGATLEADEASYGMPWSD
jgi:outer membrane protein assembly factor BamE (lipoprotein component of BamABCDE complex)